MVDGNIIFALSESFSDLNSFIESMIGDLEQMNDFIDEQLYNLSEGETDRSVLDTDHIKKTRP